MMRHFNHLYRGRSIEVVIEPTERGCEAWFLVDGTARSVPRPFDGPDLDAAITETFRVARAWVDKRPQPASLHAVPLGSALLKHPAPQSRPPPH